MAATGSDIRRNAKKFKAILGSCEPVPEQRLSLDDRCLAFSEQIPVARLSVKGLGREGLIGPPDRDVGVAGSSQAEMECEVVLHAIVAVPSADLLGLLRLTRIHGNAGSYGAAVDTVTPFEAEL